MLEEAISILTEDSIHLSGVLGDLSLYLQENEVSLLDFSSFQSQFPHQDYAKALPVRMEQVELKRKQFGEEHPDYATSLVNQGGLLLKLRQPRAAVECFSKALAIYDAKLPPGHPHIISTLGWLARARRARCDRAFASKE